MPKKWSPQGHATRDIADPLTVAVVDATAGSTRPAPQAVIRPLPPQNGSTRPAPQYRALIAA